MTIALRPVNVGTQTVRYSYSAGGDATALTLTTANAVVDRTITLPGGVILTRRSTTHNTWAYPNIHGDITYTLDHNGQISGPFLYDPYGNPLTSTSETSPGDFDNGWLGQHQRPTEHQPELRPTIEMGARPYRPELGRFLRIDPIKGGATDSDYAYVGDPINEYDITGKCGTFGNPFKKCGKGHRGNKGFLGGVFSKTARVTNTVVRKTYQTARFVNNLPATTFGYAVTKLTTSGSSCGFDVREVMIVCRGASRSSFNQRGGTTYGSLFVTSDNRIDRDLLRHEAKHADQWLLGSFLFPVAYGLSSVAQKECNVFENWAGYADGEYFQCIS